MTDMVAYASPLLFLLLCGAAIRSDGMLRTFLTFLVAFLAQNIWIMATGVWTPWEWMTAVDIVAAAVVIRHPANRWQGYIGIFYLVQIMMHLGYGANVLLYGHDFARELVHWWWNNAIGYAKLFLAGGWVANALIAGHFRRADRRSAYRSSHMAGS